MVPCYIEKPGRIAPIMLKKLDLPNLAKERDCEGSSE